MKIITPLLFTLIIISGCATIHRVENLQGSDLRQINVRTLEADYKTTYNIVIEALKSEGFNIADAYESTGIIQTSKRMTNIFKFLLSGPEVFSYEVTLTEVSSKQTEIELLYHEFRMMNWHWYNVDKMLSVETYRSQIDRIFNKINLLLEGKFST